MLAVRDFTMLCNNAE